MSQSVCTLPFEYVDTPERRVLERARDGLPCIPALGCSRYTSLRPMARCVISLVTLAVLLPGSSLADPADACYRQAHACLASNRFAEAATHFAEAAASTNPATAAAAWLGRGEALYGARDWAAASAAYGALLEKYPASPLAPNALCGRGFAEAQAGQLPRALAAFAAVAEHYPSHALAATAATATGTVARALADQRRQQASEALAQEVAALNARVLAGNFDEAAAAAERFLHAHPADPRAADVRLLAADCALRSGDWARALRALNDFLARHPLHAQAGRAQLARAQSLDALGRYAEAADAAAAAQGQEAAFLCADSLLKAGRPAEALARYETLAKPPANAADAARATLAAGDCHAALRQWDAAERAYLSVEVLLDSDALRPVALGRLADLYEKMGRPEQAAGTRAELKRRYPGRP